MAEYHAPIDDMRFVLHEVVDYQSVASLPGYEEATPELVDMVLEENSKFCEEVLFPLNRPGDEQGCRFENGVVRTPDGFKEAYDGYSEAGWMALACDPNYGGQGLPGLLNAMLAEMLCSSNLSFSMYVGLTHGAYNAISAHGSDDLKSTYLPNLVSGRWSGTMCLTEPQCGTDLGLIRTKAEPADDGTYHLTGTKIFISAGEHDLTENIIHLALARLPDAPPGIKGISLFLVPKFLPKPDGTVGPRNGVVCGGIEHKMGINASSTCVINFDEATGYLIGHPHKGMRAMFTMMNTARLDVGIQGLGVASAAYQGAVGYARERGQGRSLKGTQHADRSADPIIVHPDVRRMLLTIRAQTEGARALAAWVAKQLDIAGSHPDEETRQAADDLLALLTPIVKAALTDIGVECANLGIQIYGGHGYIREHGMEQYARDARITQIYEGTNGIQALDLVGRKLPAHMGRYLRRFFHPVQAYIDANADEPVLKEFVEPLGKAFGRLQRATGWVAQEGLRDPEQAAAAASDYLKLFSIVAIGYMWAQMAEIALSRLDENGEAGVISDRSFYQAKVDTARFFMQRLMPQTSGLFAAIMSGAGSITEFEEAAF